MRYLPGTRWIVAVSCGPGVKYGVAPAGVLAVRVELVVVLVDVVPPELEEVTRRAAHNCPERAITVTE